MKSDKCFAFHLDGQSFLGFWVVNKILNDLDGDVSEHFLIELSIGEGDFYIGCFAEVLQLEVIKSYNGGRSVEFVTLFNLQ